MRRGWLISAQNLEQTPRRNHGPDGLEQQEAPLPLMPSERGEHDRAGEVEDEIEPRRRAQPAELGSRERGQDEESADDLNDLIHWATHGTGEAAGRIGPDTVEGAPNIVTPLITAIGGDPNLAALRFTINGSRFQYGDFINAMLTFLIVATVLFFFVIKPTNALLLAELLDRLLDLCAGGLEADVGQAPGGARGDPGRGVRAGRVCDDELERA